MASQSEAVLKLATSVAAALQEFARDYPAEIGTPLDEDTNVTGLGRRQQQVYELLQSAPSDGMKTSELADAIKYDAPNAYLTLKSLVARGLVEMIPGSSPQRWRTTTQRGSSAPYLVAAQLVRAGEWTTYGDVSIAVRGDDRAARAVGRAAARLPDFPHPERVIGAGGVIPDGWRTGDGQGPEECRRRLEEQGIRFKDGRADSEQRLSWEELRRRLLEAGVDVPPLPTVE